MIRIFIQSPSRPGVLLSGLGALVVPATSKLRVAVAYVSAAGADLVCSHLEQQLLPKAWKFAPKHFLTSFDFGHTEPKALERLLALPSATVRIADPEVRLKPGFAPNFPFHPKMFIADRGKTVGTLIGSANISNAAFTDSSEAAILEDAVADVPELNSGWSALWNNASDLTQALYTDYEKRWNKLPNVQRETPPQEPAETREVVTFLSAIGDGALAPEEFDHLWVEAGSMSSGGSHSQLELPRGGNRFFGGDFDDYARGGGAAVAICDVNLHARGTEWVRPLRWHSHNGMERLNLPTLFQGGYEYVAMAVLFTRRPDSSFDMVVAQWDSTLARRWRAASKALGRVYRLGENSTRICGVF
jgi:HKD family nuclease